MSFSLKSKTAIGIGLLFGLLLTLSVVSFVFINRLSEKTENLLTANYLTMRYCNQMRHALDASTYDTAAYSLFEKNLVLQEKNITEPGEEQATEKLQHYFDVYKNGDKSPAAIHAINNELYTIFMLNQNALEHKNSVALHTAGKAKLWISVLTVIVVLIGFTLTLNFPGYIANPIRMLTEGITEIAQKNYSKRIYLDNNDEFGEMASAFNQMAEKLYEYEHSNLSKLMFGKKRIETIINQMEDAVIGLDAENKILFINNTAESLFNLKGNEITGKYAPDVALYNDLFRTVLQNKKEQGPLKIIVDGKENYFSVDHRAVFSENKSIGEAFTLKNITTFKELDISKTNLLATISHELKTPISSIKMSARLLTDDRVSALNMEQKEMVTNIADDAERLLKITGELLNMTQIETGNIQLKIQKISPKEIVIESLHAVQFQAKQKNIQIQLEFPEQLPDVFADTDKASWVLINLLTNAIKFSPEDSKIIVNVHAQDGLIQFTVKDFGIGIEEKYIPRIFERYFKASENNEQTGTGLGLAISKEFIDAQGGSIEVKSQYGKGSEFSFSLPITNGVV